MRGGKNACMPGTDLELAYLFGVLLAHLLLSTNPIILNKR